MKLIISKIVTLFFIVLILPLGGCNNALAKDDSIFNLMLLALISQPTQVTNLKNNSTVHTGFLVGTGGRSVEVSIDGGQLNKATMAADGSWTFQLPTGSSTWRPNSSHVVTVSDVFGPSISYTLKKGNNRDFNGDGYEDMVISATNYLSGANSGRVYVAAGGPNGTISNPSSVQATTYPGENVGDEFGTGIGRGDLNADGYADLVIGAPFLNASDDGKVYIYYGSSTGLSASPDAVITKNVVPPRNFGFSISLNDINSDGFDDMAISTHLGAVTLGKASIWYGKSIQFATTDAATADVVMTAEANAHAFGKFLLLGDINNDQIADLIVGAPNAGGGNVGKVYIWQSSVIGLSSDSSANAPVQITGEGAGGEDFGDTLGIGDFNGDGLSDLWVSDKKFGAGDIGRLYGWTSLNISGTGNLASTAPFRVTGENAGDEFGGIPYLADLDDDGFDELMVSSVVYSTGFANRGKLYIQKGSSSAGFVGTPVTFTFQIEGLAINNRLGSSHIFLDGNGDSILDLFVGARGGSGTVIYWKGKTNFSDFNPTNLNFDDSFAGENVNDAFGSRIGR